MEKSKETLRLDEFMFLSYVMIACLNPPLNPINQILIGVVFGDLQLSSLYLPDFYYLVQASHGIPLPRPLSV